MSRISITTERADFQSVEYPVPGIFLIVLRAIGWADSINERDEADGGGLGGLDQPAARAHGRLPARRDGEVNCRERLGGLLRYYYRDAA